LFFAVAIALFAAAFAAPTKVAEVNKLIDRTIQEIHKTGKVPFEVPEVTKAEIVGLEHLKRVGNCVQTAAPMTFECHASATETTLEAEGEKLPVNLNIKFVVVVDAEGKLVAFKLEDVQVIAKGDVEYYGLWSKIKKAVGTVLKDIEKTAEEALKVVVHAKVESVVTAVATSIIG